MKSWSDREVAENIERPTPNTEHRTQKPPCSIRNWAFSVRRFLHPL